MYSIKFEVRVLCTNNYDKRPSEHTHQQRSSNITSVLNTISSLISMSTKQLHLNMGCNVVIVIAFELKGYLLKARGPQ